MGTEVDTLKEFEQGLWDKPTRVPNSRLVIPGQLSWRWLEVRHLKSRALLSPIRLAFSQGCAHQGYNISKVGIALVSLPFHESPHSRAKRAVCLAVQEAAAVSQDAGSETEGGLADGLASDNKPTFTVLPDGFVPTFP